MNTINGEFFNSLSQKPSNAVVSANGSLLIAKQTLVVQHPIDRR
jgi:hypothetical protein